tara:strand:+ start:22956 stop:23480 length:525 start_codon:yes stop_codon:yes gene_type:complete
MGHKIHVYPHNDLLNLAHYHRQIINDKLSNNNEEALALDCMSCLIAMAFSVEAFVNFIGKKRVKSWKERRPYNQKISDACEAVGLHFDKSQEPYTTLWKLKELRDDLAHGKPEDFSTEAKTREELRGVMSCSWDHHLTSEFVNHAFVMVKSFQKSALEGGKISLGETLTSATGR